MTELRNVTKAFGDKTVFRDFSHAFAPDRAYALVGPSGVGKTTLLRLIAGLETPDRGVVLRPAGLRVRMVFQEDRLLPQLSVLHNVMLESGAEQTARELLRALELEDEAGALPKDLSGGMRRRTALARALCAQPDLLLLDEPVSGLDPKATAEMYQIIEDLNRKEGITVIMITHDIRSTLQYATKVLHLGAEVFFGSLEDYQNSTALGGLGNGKGVRQDNV